MLCQAKSWSITGDTTILVRTLRSSLADVIRECTAALGMRAAFREATWMLGHHHPTRIA